MIFKETIKKEILTSTTKNNKIPIKLNHYFVENFYVYNLFRYYKSVF